MHDQTVIIVNTNLQEDKGAFVPRQNYNKGQYEKLKQFLQLDWDSVFSSHRNNVEIMWKILKDKILEGVNKYVPSSLPFSSWKKAT